MRKRSLVIYLGVLALFTGLLIRLCIVASVNPAKVAAGQSTWAVSVASTRGTIYDTTMQPMVNEHREYRAVLAPEESLLALVSGHTDSDRFESLREKLSTGVPAMVRLNDPIPVADGMKLFFVPQRYGVRLLAPHLLGYLNSEGTQGVSGIELACDEILAKYAGKAGAVFSSGGTGNCLTGVAPTVEETTKKSSGGVVLTLDKEIQTIVEDAAVASMVKGAVVVMDPYSGAVVAMASLPAFQPDTVAQSIEADDGALINRALTLYDCGSVFKIVSTAAALESGISMQQTFDCTGCVEIGENRFHCHNRLGHGVLDMRSAFAQSCNSYFIQLAQQMGAGPLYSMAATLGFNRAATLIEGLGAPPALLPSLEELLGSPAALANLSFGQGALMASPLHIAQVVCAVVNEGIMPVPYLLKGTVDENGYVTTVPKKTGYTVFSPATAEKLRGMMEETVLSGTGKTAAPMLCTGAGKTGTAETGRTGGEKEVVQSWFAGYFPAEYPRYAVVVLVEDAQNTGGNSSAVFRTIADGITAAEKID